MMGGGVGAVGGMLGGAAMGGCSAIGGGANSLNFGGLNGALGNHALSGQHGLSTIKLQQLGELLDGFSSAEILMALMLMSAANKQRDDDDQGSGALALLAGLAMARQFGHGLGSLGGIDINISTGCAAGGALNALA